MAEKLPALQRARAVPARQLAHVLRLRYAPELSFQADTTLDYAMHVDDASPPEVAREVARRIRRDVDAA